ncbi:ABC transporter ATP-binding protein [Microlunatus parietis]|uniref:Peptide/nickel transport system ATP-binding protein n=1 Tax=Microlunatus parietis TaxID=682979 RepID=A0A7Y9I848_9ACTN|nr:ABC transporter ATP-binding protein [Microlunatus parietis]NYE71494.1 peptide/nickel transport system ATP-binding protein [Microlunatus parietis]
MSDDRVPLVELTEATKIYRGGMLSKTSTIALDHVSLTIRGDTPQVVSVVGESGSGKSTLASLLLGFIAPTEGTVRFQGRDIAKLRGAELGQFRREVQAVFQDPFSVFNPFYKVDHVLTVPIQKFKLARSTAQRQEMMITALEAVGLRPDETLGRYPHQLSGGQRQRVIVARALMLKPKLIIADEPVSMVDASLRATILESLRTVNRTLNVPILYITHDLGTAYHVSDHILVMYRGSIVEAGAVETVIDAPQHPYTRLLIDSIPWPDPQQAWGSERATASELEVPEQHPGCRFADRCPAAEAHCLDAPPPNYLIKEGHVAACYLYRDRPALGGEAFRQVLATESPSSS